VVQPEEEVVLGASPPARPFIVGNPPLIVGSPARFARRDDFRRFRSEGELFLADPGKAGIGQGLIYLDSAHG
jgi:hypothetical protein